MSKAGRIGVWLACTALISFAAGVDPMSALQHGNKARSLFVNLEVLSPAVEGNHVPTVVTDGWPLTLRISGNKEIGMGMRSMFWQFPATGGEGYLVFADPDGCHSWIGGPRPNCAEVDETYVEFTPGDNNFTSLSTDRNPKIYVFQRDPCPAPEEGCPITGTNTRLEPLGPPQGSEDSGYGLGRSGRLPGLVILSDKGVGVVVDEQFNRPDPVQARNLAGYITSVAYELNDATNRTSIVAHMTVPPSLFAPVILIDRSVGSDSTPYCQRTLENLIRVDGGPVMMVADHLESVLAGQIVTIRAFVVNLDAPEVLSDENEDGIVDARDASQAGYQLLSNEVVIRVNLHFQVIQSPGINSDLDGNRCTSYGSVGPSGAGVITPIPR